MKRYPSLPSIYLVSDARNDAALERALAELPRGSALVFRHYHLEPAERRARFDALRRLARRRGHRILLSADARTARSWRADGAYGSAQSLAQGPALLRLVTAHDLSQLRAGRADAIVLSPMFPTRSHPGAEALGPVRWRLLSQHCIVPVIALGGLTARRAAAAKLSRWAAIDGLSPRTRRRIPKDS